MSLFLILHLISCLLLTISHTLSRSLRNRWATSLTHDVVLFPLDDHCEDDVDEAQALSSSSYQSV